MQRGRWWIWCDCYPLVSKPLSSSLNACIGISHADAGRLVIIPHNELSYLPFEILSHPKTGRLLIEDFAISYQYSANFMTKVSARTSAYRVLAMAPFATSRPGSASGPAGSAASSEEIRDLPGKIMFDSAATKMSFIHLAPGFPALHLATHAVADDNSGGMAYIAFLRSARCR